METITGITLPAHLAEHYRRIDRSIRALEDRLHTPEGSIYPGELKIIGAIVGKFLGLVLGAHILTALISGSRVLPGMVLLMVAVIVGIFSALWFFWGGPVFRRNAREADQRELRIRLMDRIEWWNDVTHHLRQTEGMDLGTPTNNRARAVYQGAERIFRPQPMSEGRVVLLGYSA